MIICFRLSTGGHGSRHETKQACCCSHIQLLASALELQANGITIQMLAIQFNYEIGSTDLCRACKGDSTDGRMEYV
jgi:hypothetical protein